MLDISCEITGFGWLRAADKKYTRLIFFPNWLDHLQEDEKKKKNF